MKKLLILFLFSSLFSCSSNKVLYFQGSNYLETLTLEFNLKTKNYIYRVEGYKTAHIGENGYDTIINEIPSYFIYFEESFVIYKGFFENKYLLKKPKKYYYLQQNALNSINSILNCVDNKFYIHTSMEFGKARKGTYGLRINSDDSCKCINMLDINELGGMKQVKKIDFKHMKFLDSINFKLLPNPNFNK